MTLELCIVGAGECYEKYYIDAANALNNDGVASIKVVVDIKPESQVRLPAGAAYVRRNAPDEPLSGLLRGVNPNQVVVLSHPTNFHMPDAADLVKSGHRVVIEKAYFVNAEEASQLEGILQTGLVSLIEYYLLGKTAPLHIFSGRISPDSFYLLKRGLLTGDVEKLKERSGKLHDVLGEISYVLAEVLEGEGGTGHMLNRAAELSLAAFGGGMIQDLGLHALSPVTAVLGKEIDVKSLDVAVCREHLEHFIRNGHSKEEVAETYAHAALLAGNTPVDVIVGKYVLGGAEHGRNQRRLLIVGTKGMIKLDMSNCEMAVYEGDSASPSWLVGVNRKDFPRYYPVLAAAIAPEGMQDLTQVAFAAQRDVLNLFNIARQRYGSMQEYRWGAERHEIEQLTKGTS